MFRVGTLQFTGNTALSSDDLQAATAGNGRGIRTGRLEPALAALKLKYGLLGYGDADIDYEIARHDERASVDVSFKIIENRQTTIGAVNVEGNRRTSAGFARSRMRVASGVVANTALIRESATNLHKPEHTSADLQLRSAVQSEDRRQTCAGSGPAGQRCGAETLPSAVRRPL